MGIKGFNRLLEEKGILPSAGRKATDPCGCSSSSSPWKADQNGGGSGGRDRDPSSCLRDISDGSQLLIDGNGLAFYLHSIAYGRYVRSLPTKFSSPSSSSKSTSNCCLRTDRLDPGQIATALPNMLPMSFLHEVTTEFINDIQAYATVKVFWDGKQRRFKSLTDEKRRQRRIEEESNLEQYCRHGILPQEKYCCQFLNHFPFSSMFLTCVKDTLVRLPFVETVECVEEADIDLANEAKGKPSTFVVGYDSDFYFYKDIHYIPLHNLQVGRWGIRAFCATRNEIACLLGINDDQMTELALLMGNDYVVPKMCLLPDEVDVRNKDTILQYLESNRDFQTVAKDTTDQQSIDFVRALYDSQHLDSLSLDGSDEDERQNDLDVEVSGDLTLAAKLVDHSIVVMNVNEAMDHAISSYLEHISKASLKTNFSISLDAIAKAYQASKSQRGSNLNDSLLTCPSWEEMKAMWFVQSIILKKYKSSVFMTSDTFPLPLYECFSQALYLKELMRSRSSNFTPSQMTRLGSEGTAAEQTPNANLPIDKFEAQIIQSIHENRVTVIHGETGCGKSSRVPIMLLNAPAPDGSLRKVKFFCSQPRRIAAKALVERLRKSEPDHKNKVALRMGQGWREYENRETQAIFVTTGYLVRLLANHPEKFKTCTHLVLDEVHERSVDTDILCLLCRRLMETNKNIRLVLMSATLATSLYCEYFDTRNEPIHVGTRRFPIQEFFLEDFGELKMSSADIKTVAEIQRDIENGKCQTTPNANQISKRVKLASSLTTLLGKKGSSVLIFVPGMGEIVAITESIEKVKKPGVKFKCFPVHSEIPFEEQMDIFAEPENDEVKVIIATNVAESSITLPSVDHVICLGLCRQIEYNKKSHRQILMPAWISHASSKQRAGRTGRVREGSVYRLYTREAFEVYMDRFEPGEMQRIPLDSVILMLKQIMGEEVIPIFNECLEPPNLDTIDRSFQSLYKWNFITEPDDEGEITRLGTFASSLGIDLTLGSFIGLGIQFCVAAEAIQMAAIMSVQRTPFQISSPLWMNCSDFNEGASATLIARNKFDGGIYSEPFAIMNAMFEYEKLKNNHGQHNWCYRHRLAIRRWQQIISVSKSLRRRVADFFGINSSHLRVLEPPKSMPNSKVTILRVLKVWVFSESVIECRPSKNLRSDSQDSICLSVQGQNDERLTEQHLSQILEKKEPYCIKDFCDISQNGAFREDADLPSFLPEFEKHLISYMSELGMDAAFCQYSDRFSLIVVKNSNAGNIFSKINAFADMIEVTERYAISYSNIKRRGRGERKCGAWTVQESPKAKGNVSATKSFHYMSHTRKDDGEALCRQIHSHFSFWDFDASIVFEFFAASKKAQSFSVSLRGNCNEIARVDMQDMIGRELSTLDTSVLTRKQTIVCSLAPSEENASTLIPHVPINVRILSFLASAQRRDFMLRFPVKTETADVNEEATVDFKMSKSEVNVLRRWKKLGTKNNVLVDDSLPASAIHLEKSLYAVASNALDLNGGNVKVEGLTLLPSSPLFLVLSFLTFGLPVSSTMSADAKESELVKWMKKRDRTYSDENSISVQERIELASSFNQSCIDLRETLLSFPDKVAEFCQVFDSIDGTDLSIWESLNETSMTEKNLSKWQYEHKTAPEIEIEKCVGEDEQKTTPKIKLDDGIENNGSSRFNQENLNKKKDEPGMSKSLAENENTNRNDDVLRRQSDSKSRKPEKTPRTSDVEHAADPVETSSIGNGTNRECTTTIVDVKRISKKDNKKLNLKISRLSSLPPDVEAASRSWFDISHEAIEFSENVKSPTNVIALLHKRFGDQLDDNSDSSKSQYHISLNRANWNIDRITTTKDKSFRYYRARLVNFSVPPIRAKGRGKPTPAWIKKDWNFPNDIEDILLCLPPDFEAPKRCLIVINCGDLNGLWFPSIQDAVQMESAIWLEQQFCNNKKVRRDKKSKSPCHWYEQTIEQMVDAVVFERNR